MKKLVCWVLLFCLLISYPFSFVFSQNNTESLADMELFKYYWITPLILSVHKELWIGHSDDETMSSYSTLMQNLRHYTDMDVLQYLKRTIYPESALNSFLDKSEVLLNAASVLASNFENNKNDLVQQKNKCDDVKQASDKNFSLAVKDFDSINMEKYLKISLENEKCSVDARINYNAYEKMQSQIVYYYNILKNKYDYFFTYKYDIINSLSN